MDANQRLFNRLSLIIWAVLLLSLAPTLVYILTGQPVVFETREPAWLLLFFVVLSLIHHVSQRELGFLIVSLFLFNVGLLIRADLLLALHAPLVNAEGARFPHEARQVVTLAITLFFLGAVVSQRLTSNFGSTMKRSLLFGLVLFTSVSLLLSVISFQWTAFRYPLSELFSVGLEIGSLSALLIGAILSVPGKVRFVDSLYAKSVLVSFIPMIIAQAHSLLVYLGYTGEHALLAHSVRLLTFGIWTTGLLLAILMERLADRYPVQPVIQNRNDAINTLKVLDSTFSCAEEGVAFTSGTGALIDVNPVMKKLLGIEDGRSITHSVLPTYLPLFDTTGKALPLNETPMVKAVLLNNAVIRQPLQLKQGENRFDLFATALPVKDEHGRIAGSITLFKTISELNKQHHIKNDFIASISHELRTPLSSIIGYLDLVIDEEVGELSADQKEFLKISRKSALTLKRLIDNLLDIENIKSGNLVLAKEPVYLSDTVNILIPDFKQEAETKGLWFDYDIEERIRVLGDRYRLEQIIRHLFLNALNYTKGGTIEFRLTKQQTNAVLEVKDTGVGMSPVELESLFDPLTRSEDDYVRSISGTGLGLPIIKALVEQHHGSIEVKSEKHVGSEFTVRLPLLKK